ncbi:MAG: pseudouridine-5'-phosphate glycosidase [Gammaproteobacteria bacterium]|nr:pseudouridine-5'-phosphate glycosidase [Gammaproteobacteria bacterium]
MDVLDVRSPVAEAMAHGKAVVALESTAISHGLPWPHNIETASAMQQAIREERAVPAVIGISAGRICVGLTDAELERFAKNEDIEKASRRDLAALLTQRCDGATTVAGTLTCAAMANIDIFATGGIGGVHRGAETTLDISADLTALGRYQLAVVCSGAKSILDLPKTLEVLETEGVTVVGYQTDSFPAFHCRDSGLAVDYRVDTPEQAAKLIAANRQICGAACVLIVNPVPIDAALGLTQVERWIAQALTEAEAEGVSGKDVTPFLLERLSVLSKGKTLRANKSLLRDNAQVAAQIAVALAGLES